MRKNLIGIFALILILPSCTSSSTSSEMEQTITSKTVNGELVVTVETTEDGVTTSEIFKGKKAEAKMKELSKYDIDTDSVDEMEEVKETVSEDDSKKVEMINENEKKTLTIEETKEGKTTKETYSGTEAEKKMKELESEQ